jgi:glutathione S-transferase
VLDPAIAVHLTGLTEPLNEQTWDGIEHVEKRLADTLTSPGPWLLGEWFTAADVMIGSIVVAAVFNKLIPENQVIWGYAGRIMERPAFQRAADLTWPQDKFPRA